MNVIITWANDNNKTLLSEFIVSLRTLGKYEGSLIVIDYGLPDWFRQIFNENIEYIQFNSGEINIETHKFLSIIPICKKYDKVVLFDADMWFQKNVNTIFDIIPSEGTLTATEQNSFFFRFQENFINLLSEEKHKEKIYEIKKKFGVQINAGFVAGTGKTLYKKFLKYEDYLNRGLIRKQYGADQLFLNIDFEEGVDDTSFLEYNTIVTNVVNADNELGVNKEEVVLSTVLHVACSIFYIPIDIKQVLFRFRHKYLYLWYLNKLGILEENLSSNVFGDESVKEEFIQRKIPSLL